MTSFRRGDIIRTPNGGGGVLVLGGPTSIDFRSFYTVMALDPGVLQGFPQRFQPPGHTFLLPLSELSGSVTRSDGTEFRFSSAYRAVIIGFCPECDEDGSIFYEGDYICSWCREMLEDSCV